MKEGKTATAVTVASVSIGVNGYTVIRSVFFSPVSLCVFIVVSVSVPDRLCCCLSVYMNVCMRHGVRVVCVPVCLSLCLSFRFSNYERLSEGHSFLSLLHFPRSLLSSGFSLYRREVTAGEVPIAGGVPPKRFNWVGISERREN